MASDSSQCVICQQFAEKKLDDYSSDSV